MKNAMFGAAMVSALCGSVTAQTNLIRNSGFEAENLEAWSASKNVTLERVSTEDQASDSALRVEWSNVGAFSTWAAVGNLLRSTDRILDSELRRDTRYRLRCRMKVERFELTPAAEQWYARQVEGQYDRPTVTVSCRGGYWNSGMPWLAYDMTKPGKWQDVSGEFVTPYNETGGFSITVDAYPHQNTAMCSSGVLYIDDVTVEPCPTRIGFTQTKSTINVDGDLSDWWETNPAVITGDQAVDGTLRSNHDVSGLFYTMWDEDHLYLAAKVIDDEVIAGHDGIAVWINDCEYFFSSTSQPDGCTSVLKPVRQLGSTANMYRIVAQCGEEVRERGGYLVEAAIPAASLRPGGKLRSRNSWTMALEICDSDGTGKTKRLRFPLEQTASDVSRTAEALLADEKGEICGGEYPVYAVTDAGNARNQPRRLAVKNATAHLVTGGRLAYPSALYRHGDSDRVDAIVSWTTNIPASGYIQYGSDTNYGIRVNGDNGVGDPAGRAMRAVVRDLEPNRQYHFRVVTRSGDGSEQSSADCVLNPRLTKVRGVEYGRIALTVRDPAGIPRTQWPITSGVPFPQSRLDSIDNLRLVDASGGTVPAQFLQTAEWPDGSIKWVLLDFQADVPADGESTFELEYGQSVSASPIATDLKVETDSDQLTVDTGAIRFVINKHNFRLFDQVVVGNDTVAEGGKLWMVDAQGNEYAAGRPTVVDVEERGPLRTCIRVAGTFTDADGSRLFDYETRIHAFAGKPFVRVIHNYRCQTSERPAGLEGSRPLAVQIRSMSLEFPLRAGPAATCRVGAVAGPSVSQKLVGDGIEIRQRYESEGVIAGRPIKRLAGWLFVGDTLVSMRDFWQLYPKAMSVRPNGDGCVVRVDMLPEIAPAAYVAEPGTAEDYVWGYLRDGLYRLRRGEGRAHDIFISFGVDPAIAEELASAQVAEPLFAVAEPHWYCASGALGNAHPGDPLFSEYDQAFDRGLDGLLRGREKEPLFDNRFGRYGLRNFGDNFGSDGMNWDNLEYDMTHCCLMQFLRTGDLRALRVAREACLHNMDVDCVHIRDGWEHLCHHTGDHNVQLAGTGHSWCEGLWEYYFLTGDRHAAEKALGVSNDFARRTAAICAQGQPGAGGARDLGWSVVGLMAAYHATCDPLYLNAAREIEEVAVRTQHPFSGGWKHHLSTGHCFHAPAHVGRVHFMQDIVLNGQVRFHQVTGDADVRECLVRAGKAFVNEFHDQQARGLPGWGYTSCPFLLEPGLWHENRPKHSFGSLKNYEAMYYACCLTGDSDLTHKLLQTWPESGHLWSGSFSSQGKGFAQATRWAPSIMYHISQLPGRNQSQKRTNQLYRVHSPTLRVVSSTDPFSERLGMTFGEAKARSRNCFWGMLDRHSPPRDSLHVGAWSLHLKKWRGEILRPERNLYDDVEQPGKSP